MSVQTDEILDTAISPDLLRKAAEVVCALPHDEAASLGCNATAIVGMLLREGITDQRTLASLGAAISARLVAFAVLMNSGELGKWIGPSGPAAYVDIDQCIFEVAAIAPLRETHGRYRFETG